MADAIVMLPCPFCGGPPVAMVRDVMTRRPAEPMTEAEYPDQGQFVAATVFCHECGAEGPAHEDFLYSPECYRQAEQEGAKLWNQRDSRNGAAYEPGSYLNLVPRPDQPQEDRDGRG